MYYLLTYIIFNIKFKIYIIHVYLRKGSSAKNKGKIHARIWNTIIRNGKNSLPQARKIFYVMAEWIYE